MTTGKIFEVEDFRFEIEQTLVDKAGISFGTRYRDHLSFRNRLCGSAAAHHRGDTQLAGNDGGMAGATAAVGDDGRGAPDRGALRAAEELGRVKPIVPFRYSP